MDLLDDDSNNLFSSFLRNSQRCTSDNDQQFARPIEDEDIFGLGLIENGPILDEDVQPVEEPGLSPGPTPEVQSPAKLKLKQIKQQIKEKILAKGIVPKPLRPDGEEFMEGLISIESKPAPPARLIFEHAQEKRVKDQYGLYKGQKLKWDIYKDYLSKKMCTDKRKQWDSFQAPPDAYDDEEELIEEANQEAQESDGEKADDNVDGQEDKDDGDDAGEDEYEEDAEDEDENDENESESNVGDEEDEEDEESDDKEASFDSEQANADITDADGAEASDVEEVLQDL